jgi:two-component system, OmpR family, sensor histidine kinase ArlS
MVKFFHSIKFKLTLWYSFILILSSCSFLFIFNVLITQHFQTRFVPDVEIELPPGPGQPVWFRELPVEDRENIYESRMDDLEMIRQISLLMLVPLLLVSFGGGYVIADRMLLPLKGLNARMRTITSKELQETIQYIDSGDEMTELIENFNAMILRLKSNFDSQRQFVENASHELKTPLAVVQTNLAAALEQKGVSKSDAGILIHTAMRSTQFMDKLIEDLLLLSVLEQNVPRRTVDVQKVVKRGIEQLRERSQARKIGFETNYYEGPLVVNANEILLQRAIMNIIENAIKYSTEGSVVKISLTEEKECVLVTVIDTGPGIPEESRKRIFERFYRLDNSRSKKTGGVGLGLAIAKQVVELSGGRISVESHKNGSTFRIAIPKLKVVSNMKATSRDSVSC